MRAIVQRVARASVVVADKTVAAVGEGLLVYLGVSTDDGASDASYLAEKVVHLRIFEDHAGRMNLNVLQESSQVLVVSAFTVQADARRGRRPTLDKAAPHETAKDLYEQFCRALTELGVIVTRGVFRATMNVESINAGPVCVLLDSKKVF